MWADRTVALFAFVLPLFVVLGAKDTFRLPKDALFRAEAILLACIYLAAVIVRPPASWRIDWKRPEIALPLLIVLWTAIATLASTNRARSIDSLVTVCASVVVFFATVAFARRRDDAALFLIVIPAALNAILGALQEFDVWQPFNLPDYATHHQRSTGLIGNPNDAGVYLAIIALASIAAATAARQYRAVFAAAAAILTAGLLVNQTLTAIVAFVIGAIVLAAMRSRQTAMLSVGAIVLVAAIAIGALPPLRERAANMREWFRTRNYNALLTDRVAPFVTASMMARDHPLTGVGPGCFAWQYFPYKIAAEKKHTSLRNAFNRETNFGETHNDHLQVLAESGVPGYALMLAATVALGFLSRRRPDAADTERRDFARTLALPLAVSFFVLALAQFPLELTAVSSQLIFLAALCTAWVEG